MHLTPSPMRILIQSTIKAFVALSSLLLLSGCLELDMDLRVTPNGSAKLDITSTLEAKSTDPMMDKVLQFHPKAKASPKVIMARRSTWEAMAEQLGRRVTLESYTSETLANGSLHTQARFDVPDIRSLKLGMMIAAIPLKPYGLAPQNWNYRFLKSPNQAAYTLLSPNPRPVTDAQSAHDVLGPIANLPITERWLKNQLASAQVDIRIHHEPTTIKTTAQKTRDGSFSLFSMDLKKMMDAGALPELLRLTDLSQLRELQARGVSGLSMQEATPIKTRW